MWIMSGCMLQLCGGLCYIVCLCDLFFFKQKTAYEMRISDWSSDVCSSDLEAARQGAAAALIVHDTEPAAYGWNVVESSWTGTQYLDDSKNGGADQTAAHGWIQLEKAKQLLAGPGPDFDAPRQAAKANRSSEAGRIGKYGCHQ